MPAIVPIVVAAASIYTAKKSADASKNAAQTQSDSADKALQLQRDMYQQQQTNLAPYRAMGNGSLGNLANFQSFSGVPGQYGAGVQSQYQHPLSPGFQMPQTLAQPAPQQQQGSAALGSGTLADPIHRLFGSHTAQPGGLVTMKAPTGEISQVPPDQVPHYQQLGAQVMQ